MTVLVTEIPLDTNCMVEGMCNLSLCGVMLSKNKDIFLVPHESFV